MAIFNNNSYKENQRKSKRNGAIFSVTMPYVAEKRLREIQHSMGLNSRSQTIVFLIHSYDKEKRAFEAVNQFSVMVDKLEKMNLNKDSELFSQTEMPYNKNN